MGKDKYIEIKAPIAKTFIHLLKLILIFIKIKNKTIPDRIVIGFLYE